MTRIRAALPQPGLGLLWVPAILAVTTTLIPAWYLVRRSTERGWGPWESAVENSVAPLMIRSLSLAATVAAISIAVALPAAWLTTRASLPARRLWPVLMAVPLAIPSYVMALAVVALLGPRGMLQGWLEPLGVDRLPEVYGFWGAVLTLTAVSFPYVYLVLRAALLTGNRAEEEAARSLGTPPARAFFEIAFPALVPAVAAGALLVALYCLSDFGAVSTLNYDSFTRAIFIEYQTSFDRTGAAVLGSMLALVTLVILAVELGLRVRLRGRAASRQAPARLLELGPWRWPAVAFLSTVSLVSIGIPVGVLLYWLAKGIQAGATFPDVGLPARHSLALAVSAAAVTVVLALPIALLAVRARGPLAMFLEQAAFLTHALPGLVVALALVFFGIAYARDFYQTVWMLILAYVILFLPNALSALRAALVRLPPRLEDAGASLGRGPFAVLATVTLPLARPGVVAAAALVFLTVVKELPATLILSPPGYQTLPGVIWSRSTDALYAGAALPALLLIAIAALPLALLTWRGELGGVDT